MEKSEEIKKIRRRIEEKLRQNFSDNKIIALATLLEVPTKSEEKSTHKE
jgi:hypothetical protein